MTGYFHFSLTQVLMRAFAHCILTYIAAVVMWCLVEKPFATLTDAMMPKKKQQRVELEKPQQQNNRRLPQSASNQLTKEALLADASQSEPDAEPPRQQSDILDP